MSKNMVLSVAVKMLIEAVPAKGAVGGLWLSRLRLCKVLARNVRQPLLVKLYETLFDCPRRVAKVGGNDIVGHYSTGWTATQYAAFYLLGCLVSVQQCTSADVCASPEIRSLLSAPVANTFEAEDMCAVFWQIAMTQSAWNRRRCSRLTKQTELRRHLETDHANLLFGGRFGGQQHVVIRRRRRLESSRLHIERAVIATAATRWHECGAR